MYTSIHDPSISDRLVSEIENRVNAMYPNAEITVKDMLKYNGTHVKQAMIVAPELQGKPVPVIPLDEAIEKIEAGEVSIDEASDRLVTSWRSHVGDIEIPKINAETAKQSLYVSIVNRQLNQELLKNAIHRPVADDLDLLLRFKVKEGTNDGLASFLVTKENLPMLGVTESEAFEIATRNSVAQGYSVRSLSEMMVQDFGVPQEVVDATTPEIPMYVVCNESKINGAVGPFISKELRQEIFEKVGCSEGFYLLPSSTEETIAVPASLDADMLRDMVNNVNRTVVGETEILSDNIYHCNNNMELSMVGATLQDTELIDNVETVSKGIHL